MKASSARRISMARIEAEAARTRFVSTMSALQERLRPGALANQAWSGVREKSGEIADDALQAVKDRPVAASGVVAAFFLYLAREPIMSAASRLLSGDKRGKRRRKAATDRAPEHRGETVKE